MTCPHFGCPACNGSGTSGAPIEPLTVPVHTDTALTAQQMAQALERVSTPAAESVPLTHPIDESKVL